MNEISDWLLFNSVTGVWIGAKDDVIKWTKNGENMLATFWMPGEPKHDSGDCVYLDADLKGLEMYDCDGAKNYLCKGTPAP